LGFFTPSKPARFQATHLKVFSATAWAEIVSAELLFEQLIAMDHADKVLFNHPVIFERANNTKHSKAIARIGIARASLKSKVSSHDSSPSSSATYPRPARHQDTAPGNGLLFPHFTFQYASPINFDLLAIRQPKLYVVRH
jgi:hypothetical protein